ncbi:MAG: inositol monophosphatase [Bacteroidia bacterium]
MNLENITSRVIEICREVGAFIASERKSFSESLVKVKGAKVHDLVTHVDLESEKRLITSLKGLVPKAGFITEETNSNYKEGLNWIIDPIDGTTNFVQGVPHYCISVALVQSKEHLIGVVYDVANNDMYYTWKDAPSYCNENIISVSKKNKLRDALIATGFSVKDNSKLNENLALLKLWIEETRGIRRLGSAALDLCYVASGVFDVYYETNLSAWDVGAGALIVKNAGGSVSDFIGGNQYLYGNEILATNGEIHQLVITKMNEKLKGALE